MMRPAPLTLALILLATVALSTSVLVVLALFTTPVANLQSGGDTDHFLHPVGSEVIVNVTFPRLSSVTFHWSVEGFAANLSVSVVDPFNNTVYDQKATLSGSVAGSGSFVSAPGSYRYEVSGLTSTVVDVSIADQYVYLTQSPLL
jgi:hypothetical protein